MAQTNVQAFSGDVEISSNLAVDTNTLFVDSVGNNVGIGTTTGLVGKLNIYGTANESNAPLRIESADQYAGMIMLDNSGGVQLQSDQGTLRILTDYAADLSGGVEVARLNEHELKLKGARNSRIFIEDTGADNGTYYQGLYIGSPINNTNAGLRMVVTHDNNDPSHRGNIIGFTGGELNISSFADNDTTSGFGTTRMTIKSDGNVGIGTNAPDYPLDVNGAIRYSGTTYNTTLIGSDTVPMKDIKVNSSALPAGNWYRIAKNGPALNGQTGGNRCMARFTIVDTKTAQHSYRSFYAGGTYAREPFFHLLSNTSYHAGGAAQKVRIVQSSGVDSEGIGIDVYLDAQPEAGEFQVVMDDNYYPSGYVLVDFDANPVTTGMDVFEYNLDDLMWCVSHDSASSGIFLKKGGNVGIGTATPNYRLDLGGDSSDSRLGFGLNVALDNNRGIYWADDVNYAIYRDDGAWSSPNYAQLRIRFATGIVLDAGGGTYGRSYVGVNDRMAIGSSYYNSNTKPPDNGLLVQGNVAIGTNSDAGHTLNVNGRAFANHLQAYNYFYIYTNIGADAAWRTAFNIGTTAIGFFSVLSNNAGYGQPSAIWWYQYKAGGTSGYVSQISGSTTPTFRLSGQQIQSRGSGQQFVQVRSLPISD